VLQQLGSPQKPADEQYKKLEAAGHLKFLNSPRWITARENGLHIQFSLPRQGVSLIKLEW